MSLEKIMVVDDDPNICELLRLYLEKEGYTVEIVKARSRAARYHAAKVGWLAGLPGNPPFFGQADYYADCKGRNL